jgi:hypothetical protein
MAVSVSIRGGIKGSGEVVVYATVVGAEWGTPEYDAHYGAYEAFYEDGATLAEGYAYVVAEAGLNTVAPAFNALPNIRGWVREIDLVVELA